jgi:predicted nucleic acid-binding protein
MTPSSLEPALGPATYSAATTEHDGRLAAPSQISWGAVLAGAVVALAIGLMLNALGTAIGATTVSAAARSTPSASTFGFGAAAWLAISNLIGLAVGGYVAARLSGTADNTDGTLHGLAVWATAFLISAVLLGNLVSGIVSTAASGASSAVGGLASGTASVASAVGQQAAAQTNGGIMQGLVDRAQNALSGGGGEPASMTSDQRKAEIGSIVTRRIADGQLAAPDRTRLSNLVAAEYGISQQDAQARIVQLEQQATTAARQAEETARRAADVAASAASMAGFGIFGAMLLGAIAAILGARRGTRDFLLFTRRGSARGPASNR